MSYMTLTTRNDYFPTQYPPVCLCDSCTGNFPFSLRTKLLQVSFRLGNCAPYIKLVASLIMEARVSSRPSLCEVCRWQMSQEQAFPEFFFQFYPELFNHFHFNILSKATQVGEVWWHSTEATLFRISGTVGQNGTFTLVWPQNITAVFSKSALYQAII